LCDNQYDADGIAGLFTEDAVWESPALGRFEGRNAIRNFFRGASGIFSFAIHYSLNGHIEVDGDTARARWYLFMPCTVAASNQAMWRAGIDHETYARVAGIWMFRHKRCSMPNVSNVVGSAQCKSSHAISTGARSDVSISQATIASRVASRCCCAVMDKRG
jgi:ketosteroid isomerase-like protein